MSQVISRWNKGQCRIENGIFFPDDTFIPVSFQVGDRIDHEGFHPMPRRAIEGVELDRGWTDISRQQNGDLTHGRYRIRWGGKNWSGAAWLALEENAGNLVWLFHTAALEEFQQVRMEGITIVATAPDYFTHEFRIDIISPELGAVSRSPLWFQK